MKLTIMLKSTDADSLGGEILESLGMTRNISDPKRFFKNLGIDEQIERIDNALDTDGDEVEANFLASRRRRRRRHLKSLSDYLLLEDNALYALPYLEPLTDRGIMPLKVQLVTDSTAGLTPIAANAESKPCVQCGRSNFDPDSDYCCDECRSDAMRAQQYGADDDGADDDDMGSVGYTTAAAPRDMSSAESDVRRFMLANEDEYPTATELAEAAALEFDLYEDDDDYTIPEWVFEMSAIIKGDN